VAAFGSTSFKVSPAESRPPAELSTVPPLVTVRFCVARTTPVWFPRLVALIATFAPSMPWSVPLVLALLTVAAFSVVSAVERSRPPEFWMSPALTVSAPTAWVWPALLSSGCPRS
jgi:hypothetical protein